MRERHITDVSLETAIIFFLVNILVIMEKYMYPG